MKFFDSRHFFNYSWEQVSIANWKKYPNEVSTHVIAVDVLRREVDPNSGVLRTERLITCKQSIPKWLLALVGGEEVSYVREVSEVDPKARTVVMRSTNMTMNNLLLVFETCTYSADPENPATKTVFDQEAQITAFASWKRICNKIEDWTVERFGQNAIKGKLGFEGVLQKVANSDVFARESVSLS
ncbi:Protein UPS2 [Yarrowia sp. C11]|nr:Protein UPS2 [Yarrowia sp. E02]KAG5367615.1 Protein UPS2 [Yarrowia sp. C11]